MKRIGLVLSGCGVNDGSEIHEAVLTLLAVDRAGAEAVCLAPDIEQTEVVNHLTGAVEKGAARNVLVESARIARGKVSDLAKATPADFDALIFIGGYGAAKNLSDYAYAEGEPIEVEPSVARLISETFRAGKPLGFLCISPILAAAVLGQEHLELTIGQDPETAAKLVQWGSHHVTRTASEIHRDPHRLVVSSPAYMLGKSISEVADGIDRLVAEVVRSIS